MARSSPAMTIGRAFATTSRGRGISMWKAIFGVAVFIAGALAPFPAAHAEQQLIPTPYPESLGRNAQIGDGARTGGRHQHLIPEPVPQSLGPNALGNPEEGGVHRHQHLLRTPYWRQYHHFQ